MGPPINWGPQLNPINWGAPPITAHIGGGPGGPPNSIKGIAMICLQVAGAPFLEGPPSFRGPLSFPLDYSILENLEGTDEPVTVE